MFKLIYIKIKQIKYGNKKNVTLHSASGNNKGEIELLWQPVNDARSYIVQINHSTNTLSTWKHADIVTRTRFTASGLKSGKQYNFRIAPITSTGQQEWSDPVSQKAS